MKNHILLSLAFILLSQIQLIVGTASPPVLLYMMYDGDYTDSVDTNKTLDAVDQHSSNITDRHGNANKAIDLSSSTQDIRIDTRSALQAIGQGDCTILVWAYVQSQSYNNFFSFVLADDSVIFDLYIKNDGQVYVENDNNTYTIGGSFALNSWHQFGVQLSGGSVQVIGNGATVGAPIAGFTLYAQDLAAQKGYLGSYSGWTDFDGSLAEFAIYDTIFYPEQSDAFDLLFASLNSLEVLTDACPNNTAQWNIGSDTSKRVCIHQTCAERMFDLISYVQNNLTITTNTTGKSWEDNLDFDYTISQMDCGTGSDEECFVDECFRHTILQAEDSDYNITLPGTVEFAKMSEPGFSMPDYFNNTDCTHDTNSSTCHYIIPFFFAGTATQDAFTRDKSIIDFEFTVVFSKVPGEDTITADLTSQSFGTVSHQSTDVEADIENTAEALSGATLSFNGTVPSDIFVGDEITLELQAPAGHQERDFKNGTFEVELVFASNGTDVVIPITVDDANIVYVNDGSATPGDLRSIVFSFNANYLGTYTVRAGATLESSLARRMLLEGEQSSLNSQLTITTKPIEEQSQFSINLIILTIAIVGLFAQQYIMKNKQQKQIQQHKYKQAGIESQV